jgi:hypothetical protein
MSGQSHDCTSRPYKQLTTALAPNEKKRSDYFAKERTSTSFLDQSLKVPQTPRFAEATTVYPSIEAGEDRSLFAEPPKTKKTQSLIAEAQPSDIGLGYINDRS